MKENEEQNNLNTEEVVDNKNEQLEKLTEEQLKEKINELLDKEAEIRNKKLEKIRAYHINRILTPNEISVLMTLKEEELTEQDKIRVKWITLRLKHHKYTGSGLSLKERKKAKVKRKMAKVSRKANRG